ncbi:MULTISPECIES: PEP-CTERM sorting domain-containing protein [unclassified Coleofasciculus]|uniref:PEP-CTERM sorting domain-containing protein n=1 Tax=unclassified Coleofasciculus TaxID=2692782 RepID=UPI0018823CDD|nr:MULTISPECIES: PEP-CTERM sorting domain-containing protein [unclassified Coleofasciculus]MBE9126564.1 PEP-CTERM sorting domain-containing protein [Coleofasciculus sp. LEGE 07081]MBE9149998.1 PEP-CTERM sorting domain-containing protein [Coleofasciculus sp. LEGE 07092]
MTSPFKKIALLSVGLALGFGVLESKPVQAAEFASFNFSFVSFDAFGSGHLTFSVQDDEVDLLKEFLTGVGTETVSLNQLSTTLSEVQFDFNYEGIYHILSVEGVQFGGDGTWDSSDLNYANFWFNSGKLVGLSLDLEPNVSDDSGGYCYSENYSYGSYVERCIDLYVSEYNNLFVEKTNFVQQLDVYEQYCYSNYYYKFGELTEEQFYCDEYSRSDTVSGDIEFETIDPFKLPNQSVPEPGSVIGLSVLGLGLVLKKKLGLFRN